MSDYDTLMYPNSAISGSDFSAQEKQDAKMSLLLSDKNRENGATVAAWHSRAAKSGLSYLHYMKQDNNNIQKNYDVDSMSPMLRRALAYAPQYTAYFKDYIPEWEAVIAELEKRREGMNMPKPEPPPQKPIDEMSSQEYTEYLRGMSDAELRAEIDKPKVEQVQDEIRKLEIQNAAANFLHYPWNDKLYELDDKTLNARLQVFSEMTGIPVDQIDIEDLRNTKGVDATNLINLGGAVDIVNAVNTVNDWNKFRDIDISSIDANSPLDQQMYKLELLRKEREMLRDETMSTKILNGAIGSIPFMVEFALTGPIAGGLHEGASMGTRQLLRTLVASGYKEVFRRGGLAGVGRALGQGLKEVAVSGVKRLPFYIPKITAETLNEVAPSTITLIGEDGKPTVELSEKDVNDFFQRFITNALSQYSELASEEMGALLPNVMPKLVRNYVVNNLVSNPMSRKIASRLMERVSFDGLLGEFSEEEIGNFMMYGVTLLENALQFRRENTAMVDAPLLGKEDTLATLGSIAIQSGLLNTTGVFLGQNSERAMIQQAIAARSVIKNADAIVDGLKKINSVGNDTGQLRVAIDTLNGGKSGSVEIAVSEAEALFQAVKNESEEVQNDLIEAFTAMGLTQDVVQQHKRKGTDIVLSDSQIFAVARNFKAGRDAMHRIFDNASTAVFGKTAKDLASSDFTKEQLDKMLEDRVVRDNAMKRWQGIINASLRTAQENAIAAGNPVGLTQSAIRNYESMMPFLANYLGTNALGEEGLKRVDAMVEGVSFEFIKAPEAFDQNQAMAKIVSGGTVVDEDIENTKKKIADLEERIADYDKFPGMSEQDEERREILRDELFEAQEKLKELEETRKNVLNQVSPVWTGSAASYDQPSLQYVGTGEGAQVYGYGLYGSARRSVAEWYAKADVNRKRISSPLYRAFSDMMAGHRELDGASDAEILEAAKRILPGMLDRMEKDNHDMIEIFTNSGSLKRAEYYRGRAKQIEDAKEQLKTIENLDSLRQGPHNLYKQTFWPDKEENLLDWDKRVSDEQIDAIKKQAKKEDVDASRFDKKKVKIDGVRLSDVNGGRGTYDITLLGDEYVELTVNDLGEIESSDIGVEGETLASLLGVKAANKILDFLEEEDEFNDLDLKGVTLDVSQNRYTGQKLYEELSAQLGSPKDASEFLYRAGIDGVTYIGDSSGARNYVAFSDKDIRVDDHILFQRAPNVNAITNQLNELKDASPMTKEVAVADNGMADSEEVTDEETLSWLNSLSEDAKDEDKRLVRSTRWMQLIDGDLYPVMNEKVAASKSAARVPATRLGAWTKAAEHPEKAFWTDSNEATDAKRNRHYWEKGVPLEKQNPNGHTWWFELSKTTVDKDGKEGVSSVVAKYAPFNHSSEEDFINDQFTIGYKRPNVVLVEGVFPLYELNHPSGDSLGMSDKKTGRHPWNHKKTLAQLGPHNVTLTKYFKAERILSPKEAAEKMAGMFKDHPDVTVTWNVIPPPILKELLNTKIPGTNKYVQFMEATGLSKAEVQRLADNGYLDELKRRGTPLWKNKDGTDVLYEYNTVYRGAFLSDFKYSHDSLIGLFNGANASTLPHESAHWLKRCMEDLIGAGLANNKMIEDMNTINAWLDKQKYSIEAAREQGLVKTDKSGKEYFSASEMREEYFARAFETYLTEGKFPETSNNKLRSALHRLANALKTIYRNALALNAPIDDSIRAFFDGLFAVDQVVEDTSTLEAILRVVDAGAIAMPKDALKNLEKDVELAREDAETEANLAALRAYCKGLSEQKKGWRDEAKAAYVASKAEQAFAYVRRGHRISEDFLRNVLKLDEETIAILKGKRLTVKGTPAKVKSEAPAESPVQEETATEAEAPSEEPEATNVPPVTLEGINESNIADTWKSIDKNAPVIIPDVDTLYYVLDMLIKNDDFHDERLSNAYAQLTKVGKQSGQEYYKVNKDGNVRTKKNFEALVKFVMHNQTVEDFDRMKKTDSLDQEDQSGRTGYETTADTRAATPLKDTTQEILDAFEKVVNEMPEGEDKKIARIIFEHSRSEYRIVKKYIYEEYKENGGTLGKSAVYGRIKRIQDEIRNRLSEQDYDLIDFYSFQTGTTEDIPADILETMRETGYEDIMSMLDDLRTAVGERQFIKNFMLDKEAQYRDSFLQNPVWNSETGALRYMDALLRALKLTEGMKYNERKKLAIQKAKDEIEVLKVRDIVSEERNARMSLKSNAEAIMKALKDKKHDKEAAITAAVFMHANAVRFEAIRKVRERLDNTRNYVRRMSKLKPGSTVEGDAVTAIVDVLFHLKLTARRPAWSGEPGAPQSVTGVFREIVERSIGEMGLTPDMLGKDGYPTAGQIVEAEMGQWSEWLMNQISGGAGFVDDYRDLTFDQFEEVRDFVEWLRDRGHDTVANDKATFAAKRRETMDGILASLDENATGKYTRHQDKTATEKLRAMTRTGQHQLKTLVFMSHFLDGNTEFYGEHKIGAFRKLQLKVSEGVARQQFWYQKISSAVKPHVLALMKSAKDRKLRFEVKNEITKDVYDDIHGETAAFVLLNAGQVDGRQRLMSGFGWTEEELDDNLRQFTEEDFKHAEAIWAELNTLGSELAKVFYQQRHYRMKWAKLAPINLILNDGKGTHIMSEGGYYPIAYSYREGEEVRNDDIMNPFRAPARLARPSATYGREARVENAALLLSPTVIERSIMENARYIGLWEPLRMMNSIWTDGAVKRSIIRNFSEEAYDTLRDLMNQVNDPYRGEKGKWKKIVSYLGSAMAVAALGFKATTMAKQYASLSIGAERLKAFDPKTGQMRNFFMESFQKGLTNLKKLRDTVSNESPFLRDRYNLIDKDLKVINSEFKSKFGKAVDTYRRWAFFGLKWNDLNVAVVQWDAAYNWALFTQKDMTESEARAFADDFVASTQGGARDVDIPEVQLSTFGRLITPFFGPSAAAANTRIAGLSTMRDMTPAERIIFVVDNLLIPGLEQAVVMAVSAGAIGWAASGGDDEDAWDRVQQKFLISMLTEPLSGIPLIQDISDAAIRSAVTGKPVQSGVFDVSLFRPLEESARDMNQIIRNMKKMEDFGYSLYLGASIAGVLTRMPIIQVYEDYERMLINNNFWFSDERAEKQLKGEKRK